MTFMTSVISDEVALRALRVTSVTDTFDRVGLNCDINPDSSVNKLKSNSDLKTFLSLPPSASVVLMILRRGCGHVCL